MKSNATQIALVLDRSGSMESVREATIDAFNEFINGQKADPNEVNLLFVQFDSAGPHDIVFDGLIKDFSGLSLDNYVPRDLTPLHDAIGWTVTELGRRLSGVSEDQRPEKVVVVILTDGLENASTDFTNETVAALVKQQTDIYKWAFVFLAANQDAVLTAKGLNIKKGSALSYNSNGLSLRSMSASLNCSVDLWKYSNADAPTFTDEDREQAKQ